MRYKTGSLCSQPIPSHQKCTASPGYQSTSRGISKSFNDVTFIELGSAVSASDIRSFVGSKIPGIRNLASDDEYVKHFTGHIVQKNNPEI
jgi:hypothetical protein